MPKHSKLLGMKTKIITAIFREDPSFSELFQHLIPHTKNGCRQHCPAFIAFFKESFSLVQFAIPKAWYSRSSGEFTAFPNTGEVGGEFTHPPLYRSRSNMFHRMDLDGQNRRPGGVAKVDA